MTIFLEYDETSARLMDGDEICRVFAWPAAGGHVRETVYPRHGEPFNRAICYAGSSLTILTEDTPAATAKHIAQACGIPTGDIVAA
ncbi:MAG: hypothetical protein AB7S99_20055 [Pseudodonghicola sp.]